jgi:hypothetical protein
MLPLEPTGSAWCHDRIFRDSGTSANVGIHVGPFMHTPIECDSFLYDTGMNEKTNDLSVTHEVSGSIRDVYVFQKLHSAKHLAGAEL